MLGRRTAPVVAASTAAALMLLTAAPAYAAPVADYEMPFPCGQSWAGSTRDSHSPSRYAIDWNRVDDGNDPVVASAPGTVVTADSVDDSGYGRWVVVDHGNSEKTYYAHLASVTVSVGQRVDQGQQIGTVGSTGNSSGPHLHYEQRLGSTVTAPFFHQVRYTFGTTLRSSNCVDVPLAPDWNGDRIGEPTVFRRADPATFQIYRAGTTPLVRTWGAATDDPVVGDWDGNGTANPGVRTPATGTFHLKSPAGVRSVRYGTSTDEPVAGNWTGTAKWEFGVWRPSTATFLLSFPGQGTVAITLGDRNDLPVTGDWDADGRTDLGVFDQATATYTLRRVDEEGTVWLARVAFGAAGDLPVVGDWDGNRRTDLGTWTPSTGVFNKRIATTPMSTARAVTTVSFGRRR